MNKLNKYEKVGDAISIASLPRSWAVDSMQLLGKCTKFDRIIQATDGRSQCATTSQSTVMEPIMHERDQTTWDLSSETNQVQLEVLVQAKCSMQPAYYMQKSRHVCRPLGQQMIGE